MHLKCFAFKMFCTQVSVEAPARAGHDGSPRQVSTNTTTKNTNMQKIQAQKHNYTKIQTGITNYGLSQKFAPKQTFAIVILMEMMLKLMLTMVDNGRQWSEGELPWRSLC